MQEVSAAPQTVSEEPQEERVRGYIVRIAKDGGFAFIMTEDREECFLHIKEFRIAKRTPGSRGGWVTGTFLEFTPEEAKPRRRAVKVKVLS